MNPRSHPEVVVVTGASAGLGRAIAREFGKRGAHVGLLARGVDGLHAALAQARDADIIIKASGVGVFDAELEAEIPQLRGAGNLIVSA